MTRQTNNECAADHGMEFYASIWVLVHHVTTRPGQSVSLIKPVLLPLQWMPLTVYGIMVKLVESLELSAWKLFYTRDTATHQSPRARCLNNDPSSIESEYLEVLVRDIPTRKRPKETRTVFRTCGSNFLS